AHAPPVAARHDPLHEAPLADPGGRLWHPRDERARRALVAVDPSRVRERPALDGEAHGTVGLLPVRGVGLFEARSVEADPEAPEDLDVAPVGLLGRVDERAVPVEQHGAEAARSHGVRAGAAAPEAGRGARRPETKMPESSTPSTKSETS